MICKFIVNIRRKAVKNEKSSVDIIEKLFHETISEGYNMK